MIALILVSCQTPQPLIVNEKVDIGQKDLDKKIGNLEYITMSNNYLQRTENCFIRFEICTIKKDKAKCEKEQEKCIIDETNVWKAIKEARGW